MKPWFEFPTVKPNSSGDYLCLVEVPGDGGLSRKRLQILGWFNTKGGWNCTGMIVRGWQQLPDPPEGW